jgi:chorismate mutase/prephenate dehydratase
MNLDEVRAGIDRVDGQIKALFIERMELADHVARIKAETSDEIYKPEREEAIIKKNSDGMASNVKMEYTALIKRIMEVSRKYQYGRTLEIRHCFPFSYETAMPSLNQVAMVKSQLYLCSGISRDQVTAVDTFDQVGDLVQNGTVDAGMGVMEEIGKRTNDELNTMLMRKNLYINDCTILSENGRMIKLVTFSKNLVVTEAHNRLKLLFVCPNKSGSLGSILCQIADYGVNLTEIHSRPNGEKENWNYEFYVELSLNLLQKDAQALLFQLSKETAYLQILGSFTV